MIYQIKGIVEDIGKNYIVVDVGGIGYKVFIPSSIFSQIKLEKEIKLFTYQVVREDDLSLYGFLTKEERNLFTQIIGISGIGPRVALSIIQGIPIDKLIGVISRGDVNIITRVHGVGKKTAQRLIIDLKEKIAKDYDLKTAGEEIVFENQDIKEAIQALVALGFSPKEAKNKVSQIDTKNKSVEDIIKEVFKK